METEIDLKGGDTESGPHGSTDFRRKIRESGKIMAGQRRRQRELATGQLHSIAGIAGEANNDGFQFPVGIFPVCKLDSGAR
jgi:hypothetical protein